MKGGIMIVLVHTNGKDNTVIEYNPDNHDITIKVSMNGRTYEASYNNTVHFIDGRMMGMVNDGRITQEQYWNALESLPKMEQQRKWYQKIFNLFNL